MNIRLDIEYKGTDFAGWQYQPGLSTIQSEIENAIKKVTGKDVPLIGAGRTDAGVHALNQVANFKIEHTLPAEKYRDALNYYLPKTILIKHSSLADDSFHARRFALWRQYRYIINTTRTALQFEYQWEHLAPLRLEPMNSADTEIPFINMPSKLDKERCLRQHGEVMCQGLCISVCPVGH